MKKKRRLISIFTTTWGHKSIGKAVKDALGNKYSSFFNLIEPEAISIKPYNVLYSFFPSLTEIPFKITQSQYACKLFEKHFLKSYTAKIEALIKDQKPKIVISAYFAFNFVLSKLAKKYHFQLINIIADPRTFHKLLVFPDAYNFVFDKDAYQRCQKFAIPKERLVQSGWFVRKEFYRNINISHLRRSLGLEKDMFTVCVIAGSVGMINILKILPVFLDQKKRVQAIFICGKNKTLYKSLKLFQKIHHLTNGSGTKFIIKGYIENTHDYIQASDLVVGKAGPNLLFETIATKTPFFAISHIAGQEDGNLDIVRKYKVGYVEENPMKAILLARKIINNPKMLDRFQKPLDELSLYNKNSYKILNDFIGEIIGKNHNPKLPKLS